MRSGIDHFSLLYKCIQTYGGTSIPGMGTIWIDFKSATLDRKNQTINPPAGFLQYSSDYNRSFDAAIQLAQLGIHSTNAEKFIQYIQREIITSKEIFIDNLGKLTVSEEGKKTFLTSRPEAFNKFHQLPTLQAIPIKKFDETPASQEMPKIKNSQTSSIFQIILIAFIIIMTLLLVYRQIDQYKQTPSEQKTEIASLADSTENTTDTAAVDGSDGPVESETTKPNPEDYNPQDDSCIYVVGSFTVKNNAAHMKNVLEKNGYQVFTSSFGEFERVGIKMICVQDTSDETWKQLKEKYPDLWVLDTQI